MNWRTNEKPLRKLNKKTERLVIIIKRKVLDLNYSLRNDQFTFEFQIMIGNLYNRKVPGGLLLENEELE